MSKFTFKSQKPSHIKKTNFKELPVFSFKKAVSREVVPLKDKIDKNRK